MPIVECVPNFSEGRRPQVVEEIVAAIRSAPVRVLDYSLDPDYHRSVVTFAGEPEEVLEAAFRGAQKAVELIDMEQHRGEHPRIGAVDVIPLIPIKDITLEECAALARRLGEMLGRELELPVYLYEGAAAGPGRCRLEEVRRGQYESLKEEICLPHRRPDFGPARLHPTGGAVAVGARKPLIAYNITLGTDNLDIARSIARAVRTSGGGLANTKAIGVILSHRNQVQVSLNLTDFRSTPIYRVMEMVRSEAGRYGVPVVGSEVIGLVPLEALVETAGYYLGLEGFSQQQVLEYKLFLQQEEE